MSIEQLYDRIAAAASLEGEDGAIRITATYEPSAGPGTKVSPPTYPTDNERTSPYERYPKGSDRKRPSPYVMEARIGHDGATVRCALLDSRQSQANRCEEALQEAIDDGRLSLPHLVLDLETHGEAVRITSLTAPHRSRDAYFRDALVEGGERFDATPVGASLAKGDLAAFYAHSPADLVFGVWDSHRQRRIQTRFPRFYTSELVGEGAIEGVRLAGRYDLLTGGAAKVTDSDLEWKLAEKGGVKVSAVGLGPIPPMPGPGGVTVQAIRREATIGFAGLARLKVATGDAGRAARAALASVALLADRLAFGRPALFLRSGCDLVLTGEKLSWVSRAGEEPFDLGVGDAVTLLALAVERAGAHGLAWEPEPLRLTPMAKLQEIVDRVFLTSPSEGE
ncbi:MAG: type I-G CRISPR-associated RAMP protein Csb1/Cas7g [Acidimicrobiales bacterium]